MQISEIINNLKNDKKNLIIIFVGFLGIILLAISNFSSNDSINTNEDKVKNEANDIFTVEQIESNLEERLSETISKLSGVRDVTVMVSISSAGEYVYAKNDKSESDSDSSSLDSEIVIYDSGENDSGLIVTIKSPDVLGVAVVCEGGEKAVIKSEIIQLVTSLFGIGSDRVYVGAKSSK